MYTVDYFIQKFEAIPEDQWIVYNQQDDVGRRCAMGHCMPEDVKQYGIDWWRFSTTGGFNTNEGDALVDLFRQQELWPTYINNGCYEFYKGKQYNQPTPKQRILAALYDIKMLQQPQYPDLTQSLAVLPIDETSDVVKVKEVVK